MFDESSAIRRVYGIIELGIMAFTVYDIAILHNVVVMSLTSVTAGASIVTGEGLKCKLLRQRWGSSMI